MAPQAVLKSGSDSSLSSESTMPASIFVDDDAPVYDVPMDVIRRPLMSTVDSEKVAAFKQLIEAGEELTPIEVAWVERPEGHYYFAFGGCHRWAAHTELKRPTIRAKLIRVTPSTINTYLGASSPFATHLHASRSAAAFE